MRPNEVTDFSMRASSPSTMSVSAATRKIQNETCSSQRRLSMRAASKQESSAKNTTARPSRASVIWLGMLMVIDSACRLAPRRQLD